MFKWKWGAGTNTGLIIAALLGILLLLMGSLGGGDNSGNTGAVDGSEETSRNNRPIVSNSEQPSSQLVMAEIKLEQRLSDILSEIEGAGEVKATVLLASGPEYRYAVNDKVTQRKVEEEDQGGGTRLTTERTEDGQLVLVRTSGTGVEQPIIVKELKPEVQGVLVVATGANNIFVKEKLIKAVVTLLDVPPYQVRVLTGKGR